MIVVAAAQRRAAGCTVTFLSCGEGVYGDGNLIFQKVGGRGGSIRLGRGAHFGQAWW